MKRVTWKSPSVPIPQWLQGWGDEDVLREDVFQGRQSRADFLVRSSSWLWFLCWSAKGVVFSITTCNYSAVAAEGEWSCSSFPPADTWVLLLVWALLLHYQVSQWSCCLLGSESTVGNCCLLPEGKGKSLPTSAASQFISGALPHTQLQVMKSSPCQAPQLGRHRRLQAAQG